MPRPTTKEKNQAWSNAVQKVETLLGGMTENEARHCIDEVFQNEQCVDGIIKLLLAMDWEQSQVGNNERFMDAAVMVAFQNEGKKWIQRTKANEPR